MVEEGLVIDDVVLEVDVDVDVDDDGVYVLLVGG